MLHSFRGHYFLKKKKKIWLQVVYPQLESMHTSSWNSPLNSIYAMHVKSLFVRVVLTQPTAEWTCESRVSCWARMADCSSSSSWKERKCDSMIKGFSLFDPSPIGGSLLWLSICSLVYLCPRSQFLNPLKDRRVWGFSVSQTTLSKWHCSFCTEVLTNLTSSS